MCLPRSGTQGHILASMWKQSWDFSKLFCHTAKGCRAHSADMSNRNENPHALLTFLLLRCSSVLLSPLRCIPTSLFHPSPSKKVSNAVPFASSLTGFRMCSLFLVCTAACTFSFVPLALRSHAFFSPIKTVEQQNRKTPNEKPNEKKKKNFAKMRMVINFCITDKSPQVPFPERAPRCTARRRASGSFTNQIDVSN